MWEFYSRKTLDPTQRLTVEVMMAQTSSGLWAASTTGREMPRQNGKGDEFEVVELWGLVQRGEAILHTVHDAVLLASQTQQRMLSVLNRPDLRQKIDQVWLGTGQQMIRLRNGGVIWYRTRTGGGGRGVDDISRLVVDEVQHCTVDQLKAVSATMQANENPQTNLAGTSGLEGKSDLWWTQRIRALRADPGDPFGYVGHTAEVVYLNDEGEVVQEPVDVEDRQLWRDTNPSVHAGRGQGMKFLEEELRLLGAEAFAGEHLGVWCPPTGASEKIAKLPAEAWAASASWTEDGPPPGRVASLAFEVDTDGKSACIVVGLRTIFDPYVEVLDFRIGVGWLPGRVVELVQSWNPAKLGCFGGGPAGAQVGPILAALKAAGLTIEVEQLGGDEYAKACGGFYTDVLEGRLERPPGQTVLDAAGADATERIVGERFVWDARNVEVLSPLKGATVARSLLPEIALSVYEERGMVVLG